MSENSSAIVSKVWNYAHVLKNAGVGYRRQVGGAGNYIEVPAARALITYLLFLKLAEQHQIVAKVEARTTAIDHLEAEPDRQITRSNLLRQSALAAAFVGNLH